MKPQVSETYQREGVYATIKGSKTFEVRPDLDPDSEQYMLVGPGHKSIHRGYYEAVKEGIKLAEKRETSE